MIAADMPGPGSCGGSSDPNPAPPPAADGSTDALLGTGQTPRIVLTARAVDHTSART
jgi:hypothetical protein